MNKEDTIRRAFKSVTGFDDYNKFNIELILGDEKNKLPKDFEDSTLYGFNVRLQTKDPVTPILGGKQKDEKLQKKSVQEIFDAIKPELTILKVFENCSDREIEFSYTDGKDIKSGEVTLTLKNKEDETSIIDKLKQEGSFLDIHKKEMFPDSRTIYYWISRENEEKNDGNETQTAFLSNILIISSKRGNIDLVKKHKIHFLRFLLKLQAAYSLILSEKVETTAVRASIAQVMARNMSHNLGSHVFSHLIKTEVYDELTDEKLKSNLTEYSSCENNRVFEHQKPEDLNSPLKNQQLGYFNQYLKSRMDYLSEVTFGVPTMLTSKMIYNDVFKELDRVRLLLNYISGISEFKYKFDFQHNGKSIMKGNEPDFAAAFPSDVLGCQAFYNIIENIIRNTAKHAKRTDNEEVTFTINFKDINTAGLQDIEGVNDLYCVEIDNGIEEDKIDELVRKQIGRINESVLDEYNQLRGHSLGLLEMEASAAFLRQIDMPDIESDDYYVDDDETLYHERNGVKRLNILKPFKTKKGTLGYRFFVQKPKEFLFVVKEEKNKLLDKKIEEQLLNIGLQFISEKDFFEDMNAEKSFAHQFLLYDENVSVDKIEEIYNSDCKTLLPLRKLQFNNTDWANLSGYWANLKSDTRKTGDAKKEEEPIKMILQQLKKWVWEKFCGDIADGLTTESICVKGQASTKKYQVVLIDHGNSYDKEWNRINDSSEVIEGWIENMSSRTNSKLPQFDVLSKKGSINNYLSNLSGRGRYKENDYLRIELFEAYHNKVIVIDERVQKFADENYEGSNSTISCMKLHVTTNVFIPRLQEEDSNNPVIPLDPNDFGEYTTEVKKYIDKNIKNSFLLIHYGILERMYKRDEDAITKQLEEWAANAKRVVVTSGRGAHSLNLPNSVCFVNLSSVLYAFNEYRNKYIINYLLNQARRKRNE